MKKQVINRTSKNVEIAKHTIKSGESIVISSVLFSDEDLARLKRDDKIGIYYIDDNNNVIDNDDNIKSDDISLDLSKLNEDELRKLADKKGIRIPKNVKKIEKIREIIENSLKGE